MYQSNEPVSFDNLPNAVSQLIKDVDEMKTMLQAIAERDGQPQKQWMSVEDLILYLPGKPARQTIYSWVWKKAPKPVKSITLRRPVNVAHHLF